MQEYIGAIDQGTSSTRFLVFDRAGAVVASAQKEHAQIYPRAGWVEHDPEEIWASVVYAGREALNAAGVAWTIPAVSGSGADASSGAGPPRTSGAASGTIDCLQGNLLWSLMEMGYTDPRMDKAYEWMARTVTGDGIAPMENRDAPIRYYAYKCGPTFACGVNNKLPCAWGGVKVMLAFSKLPAEKRTPLIRKAIKQGVEFFLNIDPVTAAYPTRDGSKPNRAWWKFGFPVFYITDLLQLTEALVALGYGRDPRLQNLLQLIRDKQNDLAQWPLEFDYRGKTWMDFGKKKQPNKWVTLRALRVLKAAA